MKVLIKWLIADQSWGGQEIHLLNKEMNFSQHPKEVGYYLCDDDPDIWATESSLAVGECYTFDLP